MGKALGIVTAAVQLGVEAIRVRPKRAIGPFTAHVTLREVHTDELEITDQPVEQGANISDHAFKRPSEVIIECAWSNSPKKTGLGGGLLGAVTGTISGISSILSGADSSQVRETYQNLLALQASRQPFDVMTGKRVYRNMLIRSLIVETDKTSENMLGVTATLREVLIAQVQVVRAGGAPAENQADPASTLSSIDKGTKQLASGARASLSAAIDSITPSGLDFVTGVVL